MVRKLAALVTIAVAALFVSAGAASAEYEPGSAQGVTNRATVSINGHVVFFYTGGQYHPHGPITISVTTHGRSVGGGPGSTGLMLAPRTAVVGNIKADAKGNFSTEVTLSEPGLATLTASGPDRQGGTLNVVTQVRVLAAGAAAGTGAAALPRTGSDIGTQLWIGAGLLALGGSIVALTVARRRENARA
jgi:LPXTG-motif cell wall-anchored protein